MKIPVFELKKQFHQIKSEIYSSLKEVLESGFYILGKNVSAFEDKFAEYCGAKYAVAVASGTDALILALRSLDIGEGDEVITTPFTFLASAEAIYNAGAKIVFADIDLNSYTIDCREIEKKITKKTKAILCVHLYGRPCNMQAIKKTALKYGLKLIEDCAQATGAEYQKKKVGTFADAGCFSFYPTKNLGAYGDGGMVITNNLKAAEKTRMLRGYGSKDRCHYLIHGYNSRLDELQAAILNIKIKYLDKWNEARRENALYYNQKLARLEEEGFLVLPKEDKDSKHVYHLYVPRVKKRSALIEFLTFHGITTSIHYAIPLHKQKIYRKFKYHLLKLPNAETACKEIITIPLFPELKKGEIDYITKIIGNFYKK